VIAKLIHQIHYASLLYNGDRKKHSFKLVPFGK